MQYAEMFVVKYAICSMFSAQYAENIEGHLCSYAKISTSVCNYAKSKICYALIQKDKYAVMQKIYLDMQKCEKLIWICRNAENKIKICSYAD